MLLRSATLNDIPALVQLITALGYPATTDDMAIRFGAISRHPDYSVLIAEIDTEVVGLIGLSKGLSWEYNDCYVRVTALVVNQLARQRGVGGQLIRAAEQWATEIGAGRLVLNCGNRPERAAAHQFYPQLGFTATTTGYSKKL